MKNVVVRQRRLSVRAFICEFKKRGGIFGGMIDYPQSITFLLYPLKPVPSQRYELHVPKPSYYDGADTSPLLPRALVEQAYKELNLG